MTCHAPGEAVETRQEHRDTAAQAPEVRSRQAQRPTRQPDGARTRAGVPPHCRPLDEDRHDDRQAHQLADGRSRTAHHTRQLVLISRVATILNERGASQQDAARRHLHRQP